MLLDVVHAVYKENKLEDLTLVHHCYIEHSCRMHIFQFSQEDVDAFPVYNLHLISSSASYCSICRAERRAGDIRGQGRSGHPCTTLLHQTTPLN